LAFSLKCFCQAWFDTSLGLPATDYRSERYAPRCQYDSAQFSKNLQRDVILGGKANDQLARVGVRCGVIEALQRFFGWDHTKSSSVALGLIGTNCIPRRSKANSASRPAGPLRHLAWYRITSSVRPSLIASSLAG